jgi:hypothetical protein
VLISESVVVGSSLKVEVISGTNSSLNKELVVLCSSLELDVISGAGCSLNNALVVVGSSLEVISGAGSCTELVKDGSGYVDEVTTKDSWARRDGTETVDGPSLELEMVVVDAEEMLETNSLLEL